MAGDLDIVAACWTTAGDAAPMPGLEISPVSLIDRIQHTAAAGFTGMGFLHHDLAAFLSAGGDLKVLRHVIDDAGIRYVELEFLSEWWLPVAGRAESDAVMRLLLQAADQLGAYEVKIGPALDGSVLHLDQYAEQLHRVAAAFAETGTVVSLEFMPFSNIATLATGVEMIRRADHPNAGLMIDLWHLERGSDSLEALASLPLQYISAVELNDGSATPEGSGYEDTVLRRRLCGEGDFAVAEFVSTLREIGWTGPWGLEILSETYRRRPMADAVRDAFETTAGYLR